MEYSTFIKFVSCINTYTYAVNSLLPQKQSRQNTKENSNLERCKYKIKEDLTDKMPTWAKPKGRKIVRKN